MLSVYCDTKVNGWNSKFRPCMTLTYTIFVGNLDLNSARRFWGFLNVSNHSSSPCFQPFMSIQIFPYFSESRKYADSKEKKHKKWNQNCRKCPCPVYVSNNVISIGKRKKTFIQCIKWPPGGKFHRKLCLVYFSQGHRKIYGRTDWSGPGFEGS